MDNHFRIRVGIEAVTTRLELGAQLGKIIDFTVEDYPYAAVLVVDRLVPGRQINDA